MGRADGSRKKLYLLFPGLKPPGLKSPGLKPGVTAWTGQMALHKIRYFLLRNDVLPKIENN